MRSFLRNRRFKNFASKIDVLCFCLLLNSKTLTYTYNPEKPMDISIPNYKTILVCYSSISTNNITDTGIMVVQSRQDTKTTGGIIEVQQLRGTTLSLAENKVV